jgi:hypothetical protein
MGINGRATLDHLEMVITGAEVTIAPGDEATEGNENG